MRKAPKAWRCLCQKLKGFGRAFPLRLTHDYKGNATLRERFSLSPDDYQAVSAVIA
jgi:hypothetical protein